MTINWKQVLEIETYLTNIFEQNATIERFLWRHPQTINSGLRVDKSKRYTFDDLQLYLTTKFPKDEMIKKGTDMTMHLFQACASGMRLCKIDDELLDINENQDFYRLSDETLKNNLLHQCAEYTGSTSFFMFCLKNIIDFNFKNIPNIELDLESKEKLVSQFIAYVNQLGNFNQKLFGQNPKDFQNELLCSDFVKSTFLKLKDKTGKFMSDSRFKANKTSCEKNGYKPPYNDNEFETFFSDLMNFSIDEVIEIIRTENNNYFGFKLRKNESPYPEDLRRSNYGNLNIFISLKGLLNFNSITELKTKGLLLQKVKDILSAEFFILPKESINDNFDPDVTVSGNRMDSSLIVGKDLQQKKLYNQYIDNYQDKVMVGFVWFNDDVHGIIYDYLEFNDESDYKGEYKYSIPFENVIFKYFIAYLDKTRWEREMDDDLRNEGYWLSKAEFEKESSDDYDDEDEDWNSDEEDYENDHSSGYCPVCDAGPGEFCNMSDPQNCPYGRGIN